MIAALPPPDFHLTAARVAPARACFDGRPVRIRFRFRARRRLAVRVRIVRRGVVRSFLLRHAIPGRLQRLRWDGITSRGHSARDGRYRVRIGPAGGRMRHAASFVLHSHFYPVRGPHRFRGATGRFGAPRSGGRRHEGFDVVAGAARRSPPPAAGASSATSTTPSSTATC